MAGAGAIRSTVRDMLKYCAANAGLRDTPLRETIAEAQALRYPWRKGEASLGSLAWAAPTPLPRGRAVWWHNGGTGGYHSFLGFDREAKVGIVVLSNCSNDIDDIALHIMEPSIPLNVKRTAIALPSESLERLVGAYEVAPGSFRNITRYRDRLFLQRTGQLRRELKAESPLVFFNEELKITLTFEPGADGAIKSLMLQSGVNQSPARRVDRPVEGKQLVEQDPQTFDGLVGQYEESPDFVFTVRRDGERLMVSVTGQEELEVFPVGKDRFTYFAVDAELEFIRGEDGRAKGMRRMQGGGEARSKRVE
jgi:hypothetical protein